MIEHQQHRPRRASIEPMSLDIRLLPGRPGLALAGDADFTSRSALHDALAEQLGRHAGDVHLELGDVRFMDVCCAREIAAATRLHPQAHVIVHHMPVVLRRIASLMWAETGIEMM
jgi:anti-anti-sigma regulatory factor